jgi:putative endonuclease
MVTSRRRLGDFGERVAAHRLEAAGMTVVERNVRTPSGEVDLVARDGEEIVFVEVRTRRAAPGLAAETLGVRKLQRMWRCAMEYCEREGADPELVRIDVIAIDAGRDGGASAVEHFRGMEIPDE